MTERVKAAVIVLVTAGSRAEAERLASALVSERLAACVNVLPRVVSIYRWRGAVERASEVLLVIKTRRALVARVDRCVRTLHSYEVPEVLALPVAAGSRRYLAWLMAETRGAVGEKRGQARHARAPRAVRRSRDG
jgi:periplasmic divalent cation tolerance protein